jgi:hypothetical protein
MATSYPEHSRPDHDHEHHKPPCRDCDLHGIDDLTCESKGVADRAKYIADHAVKQDERRKQYDTTRAAYTTKRGAAAADVAAIGKDLRQIREQLRCQLDREMLECLDEAWIEVSERLERCGVPHTGCCVEECDFDRECEGYEDDDLHALNDRITRIDRAVTAAEDCFDKLTGEPDALTTRVAGLRADVDKLLTEISDPKTLDPRHAYATLRWLWHRYDDIWWGFPHLRDFYDCLCQALVCSITGRRVLGILTGKLGVLQCHQDDIDKRCEHLRTHVVEEVLEVCARNCRHDRDNGHGRDDNGHGRHDNGHGRDDNGYGRDDNGYGRGDGGDPAAGGTNPGTTPTPPPTPVTKTPIARMIPAAGPGRPGSGATGDLA